ncbi:hypothetical protein HY214_03980 [Candidatus Roizmanbacteria bacterium]|nr:hypothetical protein [Candidatus Roizmanbacteria bacterium]
MKYATAATIGLFLFFFGSFFVRASEAASLNFSQTSFTINVGDTMTVDAKVDAGTDKVSSANVYVTYDSTVLEATSVTDGSFFPVTSHSIAAGRIYISGVVNDINLAPSGTGKLATIIFKSLKSGTATLAFDCSTSSNSTSKVIKNDVNATNVLICAQNGTAAVTVGSGSGGSGTAPTSTPTPTTAAAGPAAPTSAPIVNPSTLPQTGFFDNTKNFATFGAVLFVAGVSLRMLLKL